MRTDLNVPQAGCPWWPLSETGSLSGQAQWTEAKRVSRPTMSSHAQTRLKKQTNKQNKQKNWPYFSLTMLEKQKAVWIGSAGSKEQRFRHSAVSQKDEVFDKKQWEEGCCFHRLALHGPQRVHFVRPLLSPMGTARRQPSVSLVSLVSYTHIHTHTHTHLSLIHI